MDRNRQAAHDRALDTLALPAIYDEASLSSITQETMTNVFSFVITPLNMYSICACSKACQEAAYSTNAWRDSIIDTAKIKPVGSRAQSHYKLWTNASAVATGAWAYQNVGIILSDIRLWRWVIRGKLLGVVVSISSILREPAVNFHYRELEECVAVAFSLEGNIRQIAKAYLSLNGPKTICTTPFLKLDPRAKCGGHLALQENGVARMDMSSSELPLTTQEERTSERGVSLQLGMCYFVAVGKHSIRPCWDIA